MLTMVSGDKYSINYYTCIYSYQASSHSYFGSLSPIVHILVAAVSKTTEKVICHLFWM